MAELNEQALEAALRAFQADGGDPPGPLHEVVVRAYLDALPPVEGPVVEAMQSAIDGSITDGQPNPEARAALSLVLRIVEEELEAWPKDTATGVGRIALASLLTRLREGPVPEGRGETFQQRVQPWMMECFGPETSADTLERSDRFIEEALELVQASDYPKARALELVKYVYGRDQGEINQEVGGVMVTLAALCLARNLDMHEAGETELARIWTKVDQIRAKQASKPKGSALPTPPDSEVE
ncbi:MAG: hypothetical protein AAFY19_00730 [Pseudomonadota bacterium]